MAALLNQPQCHTFASFDRIEHLACTESVCGCNLDNIPKAFAVAFLNELITTTTHIVLDLVALIWGFGESHHFATSKCVLKCALLTFSSTFNRLAEI